MLPINLLTQNKNPRFPHVRLSICVALFFVFPLFAFSETIVLEDNLESAAVIPNLSILEDKSKKLSILDVSHGTQRMGFTKYTDDALSLGYSKSAFWFKFTIENRSESSQWILEQKWPNTHRLELFWYDSQTNQWLTRVSGSKTGRFGSSIEHRRALFDINLQSGQTQTYFLRLTSSGALVVDLNVWNFTAFLNKDTTENFVLGGFYFSLFLLSVCNLMLFVYFRDSSQILLTVYLFATTLAIAIFEGVYPFYEKSDRAFYLEYFFVPLGALANICLFHFARRIISEWASNRFLIALRACDVLYVASAAIYVFLSSRLGIQLFLFSMLITMSFLLGYSLKIYLNGYKIVRFFTIGIACLFAGIAIQIALVYGVTLAPEFFALSARIGVVAMAVFLTFSFVDVMKHIAEEKSRMDVTLANTEQRFQSIFQQSYQLSALVNIDGEILDINQPVERFPGLSRERVLGQKLWELTDSESNENNNRILKREFARAIESGTTRFELDVMVDNGKNRWLDVSLKPVQYDDGNTSLVIAEARDISQQKKVELALTALAKTTSSDTSQQFLDETTSAFCQIFGMDFLAIVRFAEDNKKLAKTLSLSNQGQSVTNITFSLEYSVLSELKAGSAISILHGAKDKYPEDPLLTSFDAQGLVAVPITDSANKVIGSVLLIATQRISKSDKIRELLQVYAARISVEWLSQQSSKMLLKTRQRLSAHLRNTPLAVIELDTELNVVEWNDAAFHMFGYAREEVLGNKISKLILNRKGYLDEDELQIMFFSNADGQYSRLSNVTKDGTNLVCDWYRTVLYSESGELIGVAALVADMSIEQRALQELQKRERDQRAILDSLLDAVVTISNQGIILNVNQATQSIFGYRPDEMIGRNVTMLMSEEMAHQHQKGMKNYLLTNEAKLIGVGKVLKARHKDGTVIPIRLSVAELSGDNSNETYFIGFIHDLTLVQQQEEQLRRSQKMDALGKLTGGIAHDFNNLVGIILGYAEFITYSLEPGTEIYRYADEVIRAGERAANLTKKLLAFSKVHSADQEPVLLNKMLENAEDLLKKTVTPRIQLSFDLASDLWPVWADKGDLEDAILNMSINSAHAILENGTINYKTENQNFDNIVASALNIEPGEYVMLAITDNGIGMDEETIERIFDPFFSTKGELGTGLGLSQVYGFVERNKGTIKVYSEVGVGTSIKLFLPRFHQEGTEHLVEDSSNESDLALKGTESILLVDDEYAILDILKTTLHRNGYTVFSASNGKEALKILEQHRDIELVLSDVIMPEMDGFTLSGHIQEKYPDIKIQLASGFSDEHLHKAQDHSLAENMLHKPFQTRQLLSRLREMLDNKQAQ